MSVLRNCKKKTSQDFLTPGLTDGLLRLQVNFCYFIGSKMVHDTRDIT